MKNTVARHLSEVRAWWPLIWNHRPMRKRKQRNRARATEPEQEHFLHRVNQRSIWL